MNKSVVLIPHYNNFKGLLKTIQSIKKSERIDVLIIDDGSIKNKIDEIILQESVLFEGEIYVEYLHKNSGIEVALNKGLQFIKKLNRHVYIGRLDCGDVCLGERFSIQESYLEKNKEIALVGSNAIAVDLNGNELYKTIFPEKQERIKRKMYLNAMFLHPCVMFRTKILQEIGLYPTEYTAAEDYAFFFNIINKYKTHNLQKYLVKYEINQHGISISNRKQQVKSRIRIIKKHYYFGFWPTYGLIRNYILLIMPTNIIQFIKKYK